MTEEKDSERDVESEPPKRKPSIKLKRLLEIEEAERRGEPLELSPDEQVLVDEARESMQNALKPMQSALSANFADVSKKLVGFGDISAVLKKTDPADYMPKSAAPRALDVTVSEEYTREMRAVTESVARQKQEDRKREIQVARDTAKMAEVMEQLNASQVALHEIQKQQQLMQVEQSDIADRRWRISTWMVIATIVLAVLATAAAVIAAVPIIEQWLHP